MSLAEKGRRMQTNIYLPRPCIIQEARMATPIEKHFTVKLKDNSSLRHTPGQIVEAGIPGFGEIPLGISSSPTKNHEGFDLVVRKVGRVSGKLVSLEKGDTLWVRGPLGKGVPVKDFEGNPVLIVAGGIGLCPTRSMIQYIIDKYKNFKDFTLFFGCRTPGDRIFVEDLNEWKASPHVNLYETVDTSDETWQGNTGLITTLFDKTEIDPASRVLLCGPPVIYKYVIARLDEAGVKRENVYVDLERRMKCGVGKCGHCQIDDNYVCVDGPVFRFSEIQHLKEVFS
jgi:sulfhydrogenase subunit gamma (sulfur reductase)